MNAQSPLPLLVVGAGIAGVTAALEAAEAGHDVVLVEREGTVGGRVLGFNAYFPKLCPPSCGMEINLRRLTGNPRVRVMTSTRVTSAARANGGWSVTLTHGPAYVNVRCTACGECSAVCPARVPDPANHGLSEAPAVRRAFPNAWPERFILDRAACPPGCKACGDACRYDAIDLAASEVNETLEVGGVVVATGWSPYPLEKLPELGGGLHADVVSNVQLERLAAPSGPTGGRILRPSNQEPPKSVAFVQCAGSRDVNHLAYCSAVCCLASLKQALSVREKLPEAVVKIYFIDRRALGRNEALLERVEATEGIELIRGKVGKIEADPGGGLRLKVEDTRRGKKLAATADLVVLATGMVPNLRADGLPFDLTRDEDGFACDDPAKAVAVAGVSRRPADVSTCVRAATAAAAKALAAAGRGA